MATFFTPDRNARKKKEPPAVRGKTPVKSKTKNKIKVTREVATAKKVSRSAAAKKAWMKRRKKYGITGRNVRKSKPIERNR